MQSCLYEGVIRHRRFAPGPRQFRYRICLCYLELSERAAAAFSGVWARFRRRDYLGDEAISVDDAVRNLISKQTGRVISGPVYLLTNLSSFGYNFNPISLYFCFDDSGKQLEAVVAEVSNTPWRERHCYVLGAVNGHRFDWRFEKGFHVSPFLPPDIEYRIRIRGPGPQIAVHLEVTRASVKLLDATLALKRREILSRSLPRILFRYPLQPQLIIARVYWQALKLWWGGHRVYRHPQHSLG